MSFLYPRTVTVTRPPNTTSFGPQQYQGLQPGQETIVAKDLPASIQEHRTAADPLARLPADATGRGDWVIFIPGYAASLGTILKNDIITDDADVRYYVTLPYWNGLGYKLTVETLKN